MFQRQLLFLLIVFIWGITRNHQVLREAAQHVTRFISLAQVGNPDKKKVHLILNDLSCVFNRTHIIILHHFSVPAQVLRCPVGIGHRC